MTEQIFDWNWFFAAFAQSGAALIGIIAAFIISKIIGELEKEENFSNDLNKLFIEFNDILKKIDFRSFHWYDRLTISYSSKIKESIESLEHIELIDDKRKMDFLLKLEPTLFGTEDCLTEFEKKIEEVEGTLGQRFVLPTIPPAGLWDNLSDEREKIIDLKIQSESMIEKFEKLKRLREVSKARMKPIKVVIWILIFGFLITVAYPLHFMPLNLNETPKINFEIANIISNLISIRGVLIILLTFVIEGILIYFLNLIGGIDSKYKKMAESIQTKHTELSNYSKYFR